MVFAASSEAADKEPEVLERLVDEKGLFIKWVSKVYASDTL
jgi:hypothetical protein